MKSRRKHGFQFMAILYFLIVFCMCVSRFNVIMTIMGGQLTRVEEINLLPFHSIRENLKYGRSPVSWDMLYNMGNVCTFWSNLLLLSKEFPRI